MKKASIFIADDHPILRKGLISVFDGSDFVISGTAEDGEKALERILSRKPDIAIIDITMPGLDGIEVTRLVKERAPEVGIIILSMHLDKHYAIEALKAGAMAYVLKGSEADELLAAVESVSNGRRYVSPLIAHELLSGFVANNGMETDPFDSLTVNEKNVLRLIAEGATSREISENVQRSLSMIKKYRNSIMRKLNVDDMAGMIRRGGPGRLDRLAA